MQDITIQYHIAMYLNLAIAWLLLGLTNSPQPDNKYARLFSAIMLFFFTVIEVMLISKLGLLTMTFLYLGFLIKYVVSKKKYLSGLLALMSLVVVAYGALKVFPKLLETVP